MARNRILPIFVPQRGCPHQCVFCDQRTISGCHRPVTAADVTRLLTEALPLAGQGMEVAFYGGSFTAIPAEQQQELLDAVEPFLETGAVASVRVSTRPDAITPEALERLRRGGVRTVELGCQSMDDVVLNASGRGHGREVVAPAVALLRQYGFSVILQMMTGLPEQTDKNALETAHALAALQPDGVRLYPTVVVRGTALAERYADGSYRPQTLEEATALGAEILELFLRSDIPVLRIGLQPSEELAQSVMAGPYHPALGELVKSRVYRNRAQALLETVPPGSNAVLAVAPNRASLMTGQKRCNVHWLRQRYGLNSLRIVPEPMEDWEIRLQSSERLDKINR